MKCSSSTADYMTTGQRDHETQRPKRWGLGAGAALLLIGSLVFGNDGPSLDQYAGVYRVPGKEHFLSLAVFDPGDGEKRLLLTDLESGLIRCLAPADDKDVFAAGPGLLTTTPVQFQVRFQRNDKGEVVSLTGDGKNIADATKIGTRSQDVTIRNGEIALTGTLVRPAAAAGKPGSAVVFLHGSGPLTRYSFGPLP